MAMAVCQVPSHTKLIRNETTIYRSPGWILCPLHVRRRLHLRCAILVRMTSFRIFIISHVFSQRVILGSVMQTLQKTLETLGNM